MAFKIISLNEPGVLSDSSELTPCESDPGAGDGGMLCLFTCAPGSWDRVEETENPGGDIYVPVSGDC
ncbi:hypothetical protein SAMN02745164_02241 [Marinitoga hydrogenitolerans DSM 16785]|uniref:Uncharacterized protein n=1 Tax=Marinitoga hydrogenitolerans (strain DSM 16785 / JCM 12826 / AT1271) TaxID=1122195 RepID=A0A1M5APS6_MARH1|nr:hypothetical protein [Marinitoga hydrogenitolerans]SHF32253.1 hypothetical protein SAMN02745164_02241 [Marinitoga hydrogenitolerans DSM 16785]